MKAEKIRSVMKRSHALKDGCECPACTLYREIEIELSVLERLAEIGAACEEAFAYRFKMIKTHGNTILDIIDKPEELLQWHYERTEV